jgi:hypothetical protein
LIPQIRNTVACLLAILIGAPLLGAYFAWQTGEIHDFHDLGHALTHGLFGAVMMAIGWIFFRSPFGGRITELILSAKTAQGEEKTTSLKISEPEEQVRKNS